MFCVCRNHKCPFLLHHVLPGVLTRGTRRVILVEHELPTLPEHPNSPLIFSAVRVAQSLVFCVVLYRPLIVLYLLVIALSVVLWFTTSDYLLIYDFWLPFDLRLLITFWFTTSDYLLIYGFWLPLQYFETFLSDSDWPFGIFKPSWSSSVNIISLAVNNKYSYENRKK
jgi:hypothetical protein